MGIVHTSSEKVKGGYEIFNADAKRIALKQRSVAALMSRERELYSWLGCHNYGEFIIQLRKYFSEASQDGKILQNFSKKNLATLFNFETPIGAVEGQQIEIICEKPNVKDKELNDFFTKAKGSNGSFSWSMEGDKIKIGMIWNAVNIKSFLNTYEKQTRKKRNYFKESSSDLTATAKEISNLIRSQTIEQILTINTNGEFNTIDVTADFLPEKMSDFSYDKNAIQNALKDPKQKQQLIEARNRVFNSLKSLCDGGSPTLRQAFLRVWTSKMGTGNDDASLKSFLFLSKGGNIQGIHGAIAEIGALLPFEYLKILTQKGVNGKVGKILADVFEHGEQPKTDVQLLDRIGIQVKAYDPEAMYAGGEKRLMGTNIHPVGLDANLGTYGLNIGDYMVQTYFNESNSKDGEKEAIEAAIVQAMNMTSNDIVSDTVCFYIVNATQLVPASSVIDSFRAVKPQISVRTTFDTKNDAYYEEKGYTDKAGRSRPNFVNYFQGHPLEPSDDNEPTYDDLYNKRISIDVKFDYEFMYNKRYSMI